MVYKGPLPDIPSRPDRQRRVLSPDEVDAMLTPRERAQQPLVDAADRIQGLVSEGACGGFASISLEHEPPSVVLFWNDSLPPAVRRLIDELRSTVAVEVRHAAHSLDEARRILSVDRSDIGVKVWDVGPLNDCSGLHVGVDRSTDLASAGREIKSRMKLEFGVTGPIISC